MIARRGGSNNLPPCTIGWPIMPCGAEGLLDNQPVTRFELRKLIGLSFDVLGIEGE